MAIELTKDGRTIRKGSDYTKFRRSLWKLQDGACARCGRLSYLTADLDDDWSFHVHHIGGRGLGGSKRDDVAGKCIGLCGACHRREHGQ
jgi:hypothetical protein